MELKLTSEPSAHGCTISVLTVDDEIFCYTLEDVVREVVGQPVASWKVQNETAIPAGRYHVELRQSPHFGCLVPHLLDVPGYTDVLIHWGNKSADTHGCLLVGRKRTDDAVLESRLAFDDLMQRLHVDPTNIWITVQRAEHAAPVSAV